MLLDKITTKSHTETSEQQGISFEMPHSVTSDSTPAEESSIAMSQATVKSEPPTQDVAMGDAPSPPAVEDKSKVNLDDLFDDDDDDDDEFASSAPVKSEDEASHPATTLYDSSMSY